MTGRGGKDGREEHISALTGMPTGMDWQAFKRDETMASPRLHMWLVGGKAGRMRRVRDLVGDGRYTWHGSGGQGESAILVVNGTAAIWNDPLAGRHV